MDTVKQPWELVKAGGAFALQVLRDFRRNQGLLLSGAIAYYTFLSIVPMALLVVIVLSHILQEQQLIAVLSAYMSLIIPGYAVTLTEQVRNFVEHRTVVGLIGFAAMLFFSSIAFSMLENAMSLIFLHRFPQQKRHKLVSAVLPYCYLFLITLGIVLVSLAVEAVSSLGQRPLYLFGWQIHPAGRVALLLYLSGLLGEFVILSSIYLVMPTVRVRLRYALIGGFTATLLWELIRRLLVWYYGVLSMVRLIYGPIAIAVAALLCVEGAAVIVLLGAQVIAELVARRTEGEEGAGWGEDGVD